MKILGFILAILGVASAGYGLNLNNSFDAQVASLFSNGTTNPGTMWIYAGGVVAVIGIGLFFLRSNKQQPVIRNSNK